MSAASTRSGERGTSLTEVMTVVAISALLVVPLLTLLRSSLAIQSDQTERIDQRAGLDRALDQLGLDLRRSRLGVTGNGPVGLGSSSEVVLVLDRLDVTGAAETIRWRLDGDNLVRFTLHGAADTERDRSDVLVDLDPAIEPFRFLDDAGSPLDPRTLTADQLAACATAVEIELQVTGTDRDRTDRAVYALGHRPETACTS